MERQKKVIDASVIFKWFSDEENSEKSVRLKDEHTSKSILLIVPSITFVEVINALKYKGNIEEKLKKVNQDLEDIQFKVDKVSKFVLDKAIELSLKYKTTIYDSIYVALAQIHGCELITADKELYKIPNVMPLDKI